MEHGVVAGVDDGGDPRRLDDLVAGRAGSARHRRRRRSTVTSLIAAPAQPAVQATRASAVADHENRRRCVRRQRPARAAVVVVEHPDAAGEGVAVAERRRARRRRRRPRGSSRRGGDDRHAAALGLEDREAEPLVERGVGEGGGVVEQPGLDVVVDGPGRHDAARTAAASRSMAASRAALSSPGAPASTRAASSTAARAERGDERGQVLAPLDRAEGEHVGPAVEAGEPRSGAPAARRTGGGPRWTTSTSRHRGARLGGRRGVARRVHAWRRGASPGAPRRPAGRPARPASGCARNQQSYTDTTPAAGSAGRRSSCRGRRRRRRASGRPAGGRA